MVQPRDPTPRSLPLGRPAHAWLFALLVAAAAGCGDETLRPAELSLEVGADFQVSIADGERLVIRSADGRLLLDGLGAAPTAAEGPPRGGFAVRDSVPRYEMKFGSFRPDDRPAGPW
ncbi:MAG: hypothetical protein JRI23_25450, partial [Deltaproteobacteria bacterium]|nr:hypothetical protein [Deltaproteobacteria bacterium]MBW2535368.1 hypothetical protein [Deltaproteobacteria bacterium]